MVKKEDKIAYEIEIERSEKMEQEIDHSINQMNDEFRMTRTAAELTDLPDRRRICISRPNGLCICRKNTRAVAEGNT